jgi:hypothetical protein
MFRTFAVLTLLIAAPAALAGGGQPPRAPVAWSFRNHVTPVLTRAGCNSGACHGALAGKGGLKLSLRGYDLARDYFVLTRQAGGRRIDREAPHKSLFLLKPTMAVSHGGGQRIEVDSPDYRILSEWIAAGAPGPRDDDPRIQRLEVLPAEAVLAPPARTWSPASASTARCASPAPARRPSASGSPTAWRRRPSSCPSPARSTRRCSRRRRDGISSTTWC